MVDMKLEVVMIPVADVDRAKEFYSGIGFHLDVDHQASEKFRVVQFTPPGSACSITFGIGLGTTEPGSVQGTHLVVSDIEAAATELAETGVEVDPIRHMTPEGWADGPSPERGNYESFSGFRDPDGNSWVLQEVGYGSSREERHEPSA
jgi:catechol 2,3-dioxygenase-like lactoylglutathione lyase family enzyme